MPSSISSSRSKSDGEKGHFGGNFGLTKTFSDSSFMVGAAAKLDVARRIDVDDDIKQDTVEICLNDRKASMLKRIVKLVWAFLPVVQYLLSMNMSWLI